MPLPSIAPVWTKDGYATPSIHVLQVYDKENNADLEDSSNSPIASIIVERTERFDYDPDGKTVTSASIRLSYELMTKSRSYHRQPGGEFCGSYSVDHEGKERVSITSPSLSLGAVFLDLPDLEGHRIGTYLMDQIVAWVKQWPNAKLRPIGLSAGQSDKANRERRNRFYEQFGIEFEYKDHAKREGVSKPMTAAQLTRSDRWKSQIKVVYLMDYISRQLTANQMQNFEIERLERARAGYKEEYDAACKEPVKFLLRQWWYKHGPNLVILSVLSFIVAVFWHKY
jgi:GNAT superfamily N-acetyltransferase